VIRELFVPNDRDAVSAIRGYYYQFNYFILRILELGNESDEVCIEGIEDVDINTTVETVAIQCKYYESSEYNHSRIAEPVRLMLSHFKDNYTSEKTFKYMLCGHYNSGQHKLPTGIDIQFVKDHFLTYKKAGTTYEHHIELGLDDSKLEIFVENLKIDINAMCFDELESKIFNILKATFHCQNFEVEYYYYNNALHMVKKLSTEKLIGKRTITKRDFISKINHKNILSNIWFMEKKGITRYCREIKRQFFSHVNVSPYERFFLIGCDTSISDVDLQSLLLRISENWSKLSQREKSPFCPYVYLNGISAEKLKSIKKALQADDFYFIDGYDFKDAEFLAKAICRPSNFHNKIKLKIINEKEEISNILDSLSQTREIYQFFIDKVFYENDTYTHIKIPVKKTCDINFMV
jgi:hypothetical protein